MVEVRGLGHDFDGKPVLHNIDLDVAKREIVVVMGSSGGGKTTLLRCMGGLINPTRGKVTVAGVDVHADPERARQHIGFVFQYAALFDSMTVAENVVFGLRRRKRYSELELKLITSELLEQVGLSGIEEMLPSELSGGMRKRVGFARALALQPEVLLFDEPTSGLDPVTAYSIDQLIHETRDRSGAACVVVSHDVHSVIRVADRIVFLSHGEIVFEGTPEAFQKAQHPAIRDLVDKSESLSL
jgi:phospholipid/cholesterol/gamma-HCH transport system ATP-binding protein